MPEVIDIVANCPSCAEPYTIGRALEGGGNAYLADATVTCSKCQTVYIASAAILSGSLQPIHVWAVPTAGGDAGGLDALLLGDLPPPTPPPSDEPFQIILG